MRLATSSDFVNRSSATWRSIPVPDPRGMLRGSTDSHRLAERLAIVDDLLDAQCYKARNKYI